MPKPGTLVLHLPGCLLAPVLNFGVRSSLSKHLPLPVFAIPGGWASSQVAQLQQLFEISRLGSPFPQAQAILCFKRLLPSPFFFSFQVPTCPRRRCVAFWTFSFLSAPNLQVPMLVCSVMEYHQRSGSPASPFRTLQHQR